MVLLTLMIGPRLALPAAEDVLGKTEVEVDVERDDWATTALDNCSRATRNVKALIVR